MASLEERILRPDDSRMTLSTSIEDVSCEPTSSDRSACQPCSVDEMDESYCSLSGYRQEVRCFSVNVTDGRSEIEPYLTYQSCTQRESEFMGLARFEALMLLIFALSFSVVRGRKRRLDRIQHDRIQQYLRD